MQIVFVLEEAVDPGRFEDHFPFWEGDTYFCARSDGGRWRWEIPCDEGEGHQNPQSAGLRRQTPPWLRIHRQVPTTLEPPRPGEVVPSSGGS